MRYLILSSPRTGSTMLADALNASGKAGNVEEYFHKKQLAKAGNPEKRQETLLAYHRNAALANTTPNGVFGMKIHFNQFSHVFGEHGLGARSGIGFLTSFEKHILIFRRDKVLQAISEMLAVETQVWDSADAVSAGRNGRAFTGSDIPNIARILGRQVNEEYSWRRILRERSIQFLELAYEDLNAKPEFELERVAAYLDIDGLSLARPSTVKVSDPDSTIAIKSAFLSAISGTGP